MYLIVDQSFTLQHHALFFKAWQENLPLYFLDYFDKNTHFCNFINTWWYLLLARFSQSTFRSSQEAGTDTTSISHIKVEAIPLSALSIQRHYKRTSTFKSFGLTW